MILQLLAYESGKPPQPITEIVRALKSFSARKINVLRHTTGQPVWQRNYYERIIRNESELEKFRAYIRTNPQRRHG